MLTNGAKPFDGFFQHGAVRRKADIGNISMLRRTQKISCAADFQISHGHLEAAPQFRKFTNGFQSLFCHFGKHFPFAVEKPGAGDALGASHAASHLVNLRKPHAVRVVDQHGIRIGLVQAILDKGGAHQHIVAAFIEIKHHLFQVSPFHAAVGDADSDIVRQNAPQMIRHGVDGFHSIVYEKDLAISTLLAQNGFLHDFIIILGHIGLDGMAIRRRRGDGHHVPHAGEAHVERAGNRRRREIQHVDAGGPGFPLFLLYHAEALLFVHHQKAQPLRLHFFIQKRMGADDHVQAAVSKGGDDFRFPFVGGEAIQHFHMDAETFHAGFEIFAVLLRQHRGGTQNHGLIAAHDALENGAHGDFRFTKAHIATKKHVHGHRFLHGLLHRRDGCHLIFCFHVREGIFEFPLLRRVGRKGDARRDFSLRIDFQQLLCQFFDGLLRLGASFAPVFSAQGVQLRRVTFGADVFFQGADFFHRQLQLIAAGILDGNIIPVHAGELDGLNAHEFADAVVFLHHIVAGIEVRKIADLLSFTTAFYPAHFLLPQNISGGNHSQMILRDFKTFGKETI